MYLPLHYPSQATKQYGIKIMKNITVLFVDDELSILNTLKRLLRKEPYAVLTAGSGQQGLAILEQQTVHIVISDMRMPNMNGVEFLQKVKQKYPCTKRIIMSGYADIEAVVDAVNKGGICRFIAKPWDNNEIKLVIDDLISPQCLDDIEQLKKIIIEQQDEIQALKKNSSRNKPMSQ